jgi:hypothetical protein
MIVFFAVVTALTGYGIGRTLGSRPSVNIAALVGLTGSSVGTYLWGVPPFQHLAAMLGVLYGVLMFGVFFLCTGILLRNLLARAWRTAP